MQTSLNCAYVLATLAEVLYMEYLSLRIDQCAWPRAEAALLYVSIFCYVPDGSRLHSVAIVPGFISFLVTFY